ncbi:transposase family protein [Streptomyces mirabilis]|uniref:transposase family protein n=1 Tax=Streptomyces mirabilis TaxID=68239 RepID=UPI0036EE1750
MRLTARTRRRAVGAGAKHKFVCADRLPATLVSQLHGTTHDVLARWFGVDRFTITRAIGEVRPLLAQRGCSVVRASCCTPSPPRSSSTWAPTVRPGSSTARRSVCDAQP